MSLSAGGGYGIFIGGSGAETSAGIAVDADGNAYVVGTTLSFDFPTVPGVAVLRGPRDAFVVKVKRDGTLAYVTLVGGTSSDLACGVAVNRLGEAHITGSTDSDDFPRVRPFQDRPGGERDCFVAKLNAAGDGFVFSTYLGGERADYGRAIAVDENGLVYVTGYTYSGEFPTSPIAIEHVPALMYDAFVAVFTRTGHRKYVTLLGGHECAGYDIVPGPPRRGGRDAYVTGFESGRTSLPHAPTPSGHRGGGTCKAFVARIDRTGRHILYVAYLGGTRQTVGRGIAIDPASNAHVVGFTQSDDFYTTDGVAFLDGERDFEALRHAFAAKLDPSGGLIFSVLMQGSDDHDYAFDVAVSEFGQVFVVGGTSTFNFPITDDALIPRRDRPSGYLVVLSPDGIREYSSHFGSYRDSNAVGIALGSRGAVYLVGDANTAAGFPVGSPSYSGGTSDVYVARLRWL